MEKKRRSTSSSLKPFPVIPARQPAEGSKKGITRIDSRFPASRGERGNDGSKASYRQAMGFTLVETLVVILVIGLIGYLLSELLWRTFRGSNKTRVIGNIKQHGQSSLNVMDQAIRAADFVVCLGNTATANQNDAIAIVRNGKYTVFWFNYQAGKNGRILKGEAYTDPKDPGTGNCIVPASPAVLTDEDPYRGVSVVTDSGSFSRTVLPGFKDVVTINFELGPGVSAGSAIGSQTSTVVFGTTVELR